MCSKDHQPEQADQLRKRAEQKAATCARSMPENLETPSLEESRALLHELRVHQIELEMQNEELRKAQDEIEAARARYFDLYDLAPVGYATISEDGLILDANFTVANLLNFEKSRLMGKPVTKFIFMMDQDIFYLHRKKLLETQAPQKCELRLVRNDGSTLWVRVDSAVSRGQDKSIYFRTTLTNIHEGKLLENELSIHRNHLDELVKERTREVENAHAQLRDLSSRIILSHENERKRIARELHDELGQQTAALTLDIECVSKLFPEKQQHLREIRKRCEAINMQIQRIYMGLHPVALEKLGLEQAIRSLLINYKSKAEFKLKTSIQNVGLELDPVKQICLYRIVQESMTNILKHARATRVSFSLHRKSGALVLEVRDNGVGFDAATHTMGFGLLGMKERALIAGGSLIIESQKNQGTCLTASIPL